MELIRLDYVMFSQLLFNGCAKLLDIGGKWNTDVHVDPEHPKHAQWVTFLVSMQGHGAVYYHAETRDDGGGMARRWASGSRQGFSAFKLP
jgi:hypothetical protein